MEARNKAFIKGCTQYIERNASGCIASEGWLELPKHAVIKLISSDTVIRVLTIHTYVLHWKMSVVIILAKYLCNIYVFSWHLRRKMCGERCSRGLNTMPEFRWKRIRDSGICMRRSLSHRFVPAASVHAVPIWHYSPLQVYM